MTEETIMQLASGSPNAAPRKRNGSAAMSAMRHHRRGPTAPTRRRSAGLKQIVSVRESGLMLDHPAALRRDELRLALFPDLGQLRAMPMAFSVEGIVVVGMTILLIVGGIDLSVGSVVASRW